jgi:hypothetical protein
MLRDPEISLSGDGFELAFGLGQAELGQGVDGGLGNPNGVTTGSEIRRSQQGHDETTGETGTRQPIGCLAEPAVRQIGKACGAKDLAA